MYSLRRTAGTRSYSEMSRLEELLVAGRRIVHSEEA